MSEYWKSTPKYWCKFCKVFVKDTKFERQQHDAQPRHQGNIQKSLRGLHKEKEQEDRQKQRAKDEVARLNGLTAGGASSASGPAAAPSSSSKSSGFKEAPKKATLDDRKRQMQQLADMGVAVPEEFRREVAMAGEWQTLKVTRVQQPEPKDEDGEDMKDGVAFGIRKRKFEDQEEEEAILGTGDAAAPRKNRNWGSRMKAFPGSRKGGDDDLDALLGGVSVKKDLKKEEVQENDEVAASEADGLKSEDVKEETDAPKLKKSDSNEELEAAAKLEAAPLDTATASEDALAKAADTPGAGIVFKKRKKIVK